jgi:hypothetical protein
MPEFYQDLWANKDRDIAQGRQVAPKEQDEGKTGDNETQLCISLILIPYAYKLNEIVNKLHKIITLITKIQNKHNHKHKTTMH